MSKPSARMGDMHVCPSVTGTIPHVGGPIVSGFAKVLVGGLMAARLGDKATCTGPLDIIILASTSVLFGGMQAARIGDSTAHGGKITAGLATVIIGSSKFPLSVTTLPNGDIQVGNNITITGTDEFKTKALRDLYLMSNYPTGLERLESIDGASYPVTIKYGASNSTLPAVNADAAAAGKPAWPGNVGPGTGKGTGATISYDPDNIQPTSADPSIDRPADVALHHEMSHADHMVHGLEDASPDPANPLNPNLEETRVIEMDNQYRIERGIPTRANHTVL